MQRIAFTLRIKDGQQDEYVRRHRNVWPEVLADLQTAGVEKMSIFINGDELFLYLEVEDYARTVRILSESPQSVRWERYMAPIMQGASSNVYDAANAYPESLPEVFFWKQPDDRPARHQRVEVLDGAAPSAPHYPHLKQAPTES